MYKQFKHLRLIFLAGLSTLAFIAISINTAFAVELVEEAQWHAVSEYDRFGQSVSTDGNTVVIGANGQGVDEHGVAYVYRYDGSAWSEPIQLTGDEWSSNFGWSVSVDGNTVVIGDYTDGENGLDAGAAFVYEYDGSTWNNTMKWTGGEGDVFGYSVSVHGDTVVIGTSHANAAYVYERDGNIWSAPFTLTSGEAEEDDYGWSVSVHGDMVVVGAPGDDQNAYGAGAAYVYERDGNAWSELKNWKGDSGGGRFGESVSTDGNTVVINAKGEGEDYQGAAYVYTYDGSAWSEPIQLTGDEWSSNFGWSVSVDGNTVVIGDYTDGENGLQAGAAYIFVRNESGWDQGTKFTNDGNEAFDYFGNSVSVADNTIVVGAPSTDVGGSAFLYSILSVPHYRCDGFAPPLANEPLRLRRNKAIPMRAKLFDGDVEITDYDLAYTKPPKLQLWSLDGTEEGSIAYLDETIPVGSADDGIEFHYLYTDTGYWQLIFDARSIPDAGQWRLEMDSGEHSDYLIDPTCSTVIWVD